MNTLARSLATALGALALAGPLSAAPPSTGDPACAGLPALSRLEQRLFAKAGEGDESLRRYINITRGMYGYEWNEVARWVAERRSAQALCVAQATQQGGKAGERAVRRQ